MRVPTRSLNFTCMFMLMSTKPIDIHVVLLCSDHRRKFPVTTNILPLKNYSAVHFEDMYSVFILRAKWKLMHNIYKLLLQKFSLFFSKLNLFNLLPESIQKYNHIFKIICRYLANFQHTSCSHCLKFEMLGLWS